MCQTLTWMGFKHRFKGVALLSAWWSPTRWPCVHDNPSNPLIELIILSLGQLVTVANWTAVDALTAWSNWPAYNVFMTQTRIVSTYLVRRAHLMANRKFATAQRSTVRRNSSSGETIQRSRCNKRRNWSSRGSVQTEWDRQSRYCFCHCSVFSAIDSVVRRQRKCFPTGPAGQIENEYLMELGPFSMPLGRSPTLRMIKKRY